MTDRSWRNGFQLGGDRIWAAPLVGLALVAIAQFTNETGDIRKGAFPWLIALTAAGLAAVCLRLVGVHAPDPNRWVLIGGWWTALAFGGIAAFMVAIGVGALFSIDEESMGVFAWVPVIGMAFGLLSMTPAVALLAFGTGRADVLPRWGVGALWTVSPLLLLLLIYGGLAEGTAETIGLTVILCVLASGWVMVGLALRPAARRGGL
ncbi:MAG: hypothetical protein R3246_04705 [Acidimicrobiia bacterium]|nr:hypothetical protein [Acidimicrobiia bacterium]